MNNDVVIYQSSDGLVKMEAIVDASNETIWATQKAMAELFGVNTQAITKHLGNIYQDAELIKEARRRLISDLVAFFRIYMDMTTVAVG